MANAIITYNGAHSSIPLANKIVYGTEYHTLTDNDADFLFGTYYRHHANFNSTRFPLVVNFGAMAFTRVSTDNPMHSVIENAILFFPSSEETIRNIHFKNCLFSGESFGYQRLEFVNCQFDDCVLIMRSKPTYRTLFFDCAFVSTQFYVNLIDFYDCSYTAAGFDACIFVDPLHKPDTFEIPRYFRDDLTKTGAHTVWKVVHGRTDEQHICDHMVLLRCTVEENVERFPPYVFGTQLINKKFRCRKVRVDDAYVIGDLSFSNSRVQLTTDISLADMGIEGRIVTEYGTLFFARPLPDSIVLSSFYTPEFIYRVGDVAECAWWNPDRVRDCTGGIHVFLDCIDAIDYSFEAVNL